MGPALKGHESRITALLYDPTSSQVSILHQQQGSFALVTMHRVITCQGRESSQH